MPIIGVENHPQVRQIIDWALAGESCRSIAKRVNPPLSNVTISKFVRLRVKAALSQSLDLNKAFKANGLTEALNHPDVVASDAIARTPDNVHRSTIFERIERRYKTCDDGVQEAQSKGDISGLASVMRAEQGYMRLDAELGGLLQQAGPVTQVLIVCPASVNPQTTAYKQDPEALSNVTLDVKPVKS